MTITTRSLGLCALVLLLAGCGGSEPVDNTALRERMQYLNDLDEVSWMDFDGGEVYVGFNTRPPDLGLTMASAVAATSEAHGNRKVRLVAVDGGAPGWRPGDGPIFCSATIQLGSAKTDCL